MGRRDHTTKGVTVQLLVINPNTSAHVSALLQQHVQAAVGAQARVHTVTAQLGAPYIACEASYAVAAHAALDAWAQALADGASPNAVLIGCFGDPGLLALRESSPVPVLGLAESAFAAAAAYGRFAVVTGGARWSPMLQRLAWEQGFGQALAGIHTVAPTGAQLAADPEAACAVLAQACREAAQRTGAQAVVLGGAGLAGLAASIQNQVPVPVVDSVQAGAQALLQAGVDHQVGRAGRWSPTGTGGASAGRTTPGCDVRWVGLGTALTALGV